MKVSLAPTLDSSIIPLESVIMTASDIVDRIVDNCNSTSKIFLSYFEDISVLMCVVLCFVFFKRLCAASEVTL